MTRPKWFSPFPTFSNSLGVDVYHMQWQMQSIELFRTKLKFSLLLLSLLMKLSFELTTILSINSDTIQRRSNNCLSLTIDSCSYFLGVRCHGYSGNSRTWALYWTHLFNFTYMSRFPCHHNSSFPCLTALDMNTAIPQWLWLHMYSL